MIKNKENLGFILSNIAFVLVNNMCRMVIGDFVYITGGDGIISNLDMKYSFN